MIAVLRWWQCLLGPLWPANTPPAPDPAATSLYSNGVPYMPPPLEPPACRDCGLGLVDGRCVACADGWRTA